MNDQVEEIKQKNNIVDIVASYVNLKKVGRHHKGNCPFHSEKTPSFLVNEELNLYKCFGCGAGGDVIKFLMEIEGMTFIDALERLAERVGVKLVRSGFGKEKKDELYEVMSLAAKYYNWLLVSGKSGELAREYLKSRKISDKIVAYYNLGFSLNKWDGLINYLTKKKNYNLETLEKVGLVVKKQGGGYYDKFRGRLMFPLQDSAGRVVGFTARVLPGIAKEDEPKYINTQETEIYHKGKMLYGFYQAKQAIREKKRVVLVEGQMDQIGSFMAGVSETVAVGGTGITEDQIEMIGRLTDKIYISLDADNAGYVAMKRSVELSEKRGLSIKVVQLEGGKDPGEIAEKSPQKWKSLIDDAVDVYEFVLEKALKENSIVNPESINKILMEVVPFFAKIENVVIREVWAKRLAEKIGVSLSSVLAEIDKSRTGKKVGFVKTEVETEKTTKVDKLARLLVANLLLKPVLVKQVKKVMRDLSGSGGLWKALVFVLDNWGESSLVVAEFIKEMPEELKEVVEEIYMVSGDMEMEESSVLDTATNLAREKIRELRNELSSEREKAEKEGDTAKEQEILLKLRDLGLRENTLFSLDLA